MRNVYTLERLTDALTRNCGDRLAAARECGVSLMFVQQWCKDDPETAKVLREAELVGTQGLVSAAIQRAVHGIERDVYYKGEVVGQQLEYSDTLLATLLKAKVEDFKPASDAPPQVTVNIANLMPRASSYDEWLAMKEQTLALPAPKPANALGTIIDGSFADITNKIWDGIVL